MEDTIRSNTIVTITGGTSNSIAQTAHVIARGDAASRDTQSDHATVQSIDSPHSSSIMQANRNVIPT